MDRNLAASVVLNLLLLAALAASWRHARRAARRQVAAARDEAELVRVVRLAAAELRGPALALAATAPAGAARVRAVADALFAHTDSAGSGCRLQETEVTLGPLIDFAVAQIAAELGGSLRAWRIAPALAEMVLLADRRALQEVLLRALSSAALATREGDWIDLSPVTQAGAWALAIEDEGLGLAVAGVAACGPESRGLGLGLALARRLMVAHGGTLTIESVQRVGTRTVLAFPAPRLLRDGAAPLAMASAGTPCRSLQNM